VRRDVAEGLVAQGVTVLRYGGSMVNAAEYRWKKMIGPRDRRLTYRGTWYPYSTNGWGIIDFLDLCEASGFLAVPDFNIDESPQDMADFVEYANGPAENEWGRRRVADGHAKPYGLKYIELGNEERVDDRYYEKFAAIARAVWAKDPQVVLIVGDFAYDGPITDPMKFGGAASRITSLAAHEKILKLARENGREVWFDVHVWTDGPGVSPSLTALPTYIDALEKVAGGAKHKVVVFELNANNHRQRRALANAWAVGAIERDGRVPIVCSANGLQPDGQNDNGWDQGLLFLNPSKVWLQPPGYVLQMISRSARDRLLPVELTGGEGKMDVTAMRSEDGKSVALRVVNLDAEARTVRVQLDGFVPAKPVAVVEELAGALDARNTAGEDSRFKPGRREWRHEMRDGATEYVFPPHSFTVIRFE
jgi:alpha-L-arabinofuranosidase